MPVKLTRKALKVAGLKSYFGSARKAYTYRAARRNATLHAKTIERHNNLLLEARLSFQNSGRSELLPPQRKAWWQFWK